MATHAMEEAFRLGDTKPFDFQNNMFEHGKKEQVIFFCFISVYGCFLTAYPILALKPQQKKKKKKKITQHNTTQQNKTQQNNITQLNTTQHKTQNTKQNKHKKPKIFLYPS